jgi:sugar phosphate isomerase/epimerase
MKLSFTTLGCPKWDLQTVCANAKKYGFDGIDFRGIQENLDVTTTPQFTSGISATRKMINDAGLEVSGFSTSICVCDDSKHRQFLEEAKRTIAAALDLSCAIIRVFPGGDSKKSDEERFKIGQGFLREILRLDGAQFLNWCVETHDTCTSGKGLAKFLEGIDHPSVGALWNLGHPPRFHGESPADTYAAIGKRVKYTHVKDAVKDPGNPHSAQDGWRYVSPGEGQIPLKECVDLLKKGGYEGYLTLEHEKRWHQDLPEPEEAFPKYVKWGRSVLGK